MSQQDESIAIVEAAAKEIALQMMKLQPALFRMEEGEFRSDSIKAAHALTVELEIIKKKMIQLQQRDGSSDL